MKVSNLIKELDKLMGLYGDLEILFRDEYKNNTYEVEDVLVRFSKNEDDKYIITNHYYK